MTGTTPPYISRRTVLGGAAAAALGLASAAGSASATTTPQTGWPAEFPLPNGFQPEGIAIGRQPYAYMGSLADGSVRRVDLRTGRGSVVHEGESGTQAAGMKLDDDGLLYVAGGHLGTLRVLDTRTGRLVASYQPTPTTGYLANDVALVRDRAWFTESHDNVLYGIPRGYAGKLQRLRLGGDWVQTSEPYNANGIAASPDGRGVIVVHTALGKLYHVDLDTGYATEIALKGADNVIWGDGVLLVGRRLYVVQNFLNRVSVFDLDLWARAAVLRDIITDPRFEVPSAVAHFGDRLYLVNGRFDITPTLATAYNAVAVEL